MKYALALLDPASQPAFQYLDSMGVITGPFSNRPLAWDAEESAKFIVLMTDGNTGTQFRPVDTLEEEHKSTELTYQSDGASFVASSSTSNRDMFLLQCELAKSYDVIIYTVAVEMQS